jgi:hypothetical protein
MVRGFPESRDESSSTRDRRSQSYRRMYNALGLLGVASRKSPIYVIFDVIIA